MPRILTPEAIASLKQEFSALRGDVHLLLVTKDGVNEEFNRVATELCTELDKLSEKIHFRRLDPASDEARNYAFDSSPVLLLNPESHRIQFLGAPIGEEMRSLLAGIFMLSEGSGILSTESVGRLREVSDPREIMVFVSPTCPYCPQQAGLAISAAIAVPKLITVKVVEIYENRSLADAFSVVSVPQTVVNGNVVSTGVLPEQVFVESVVAGIPVGVRPHKAKGEVIEKDVVIIGAGPGGLTAAIYAERAGLKTVVVEKMNIGGQVTITPVVENYPGFTRIAGKTLMDIMAQQAVQYCDIHLGAEVSDIRRNSDGVFKIATTEYTYHARAVILATGAEHTKLGIPGEEGFFGRGVSYCATCDGYFFKDGKKVIMVGGGNTALTEALYLDSIGVDVTVVHRRDQLRAEERLQKNLFARKVPVLWDTVVDEIAGESVVTGAVVRNVKTGASLLMPVDGVFVAIGYEPVNGLALKLGLDLAPDGYIKVDQRQRTSMDAVYAVGDVTGGIKQIVTAVGQGAVAAISAFEDLMNPYWKGEGDMF